MSDPSSDERVAALEVALGHRFRDPALALLALTHPSFSYEHDGTRGNERLEFLGDAALDLAVATILYETHPDWTEGHLTRARKALVNAGSLAEHARALGLGRLVRLGRGERRMGGSDKGSILACLLEAVIGAVYLEGGLESVTRIVRARFGEALAETAQVPEQDPKTRLQEWSQASLQMLPSYRLAEDTGVEDADERFAVEVSIGGDVWGRGTGRSKRHAERGAALAALAKAGLEP